MFEVSPVIVFPECELDLDILNWLAVGNQLFFMLKLHGTRRLETRSRRLEADDSTKQTKQTKQATRSRQLWRRRFGPTVLAHEALAQIS